MELATRSEMRWALVRAMAVVATLVVLFAAITAKVGAAGRAVWFVGLDKPPGMMTPEAFTLWWGLIFMFLGLALAIIWQARGATYRRPALIGLIGVLLLGLLWSPVLFGLRHLTAAAVIAAVMALTALVASYFSFRVRTSAGLMMVVVSLWSLFCAFAAVQLWQRNGAAPVVTPAEAPNMSGENVPFAAQ